MVTQKKTPLFKSWHAMQSCLRRCCMLAFSAAGFALTGGVSAAAEPKAHLRVQVSGDIKGLDPGESRTLPQQIILQNIMEGLFQWSKNQELVPAGAASWTVSEDGLTWTVCLRQDARWSNGEPVTAEHYVAGWKRLWSPDELKSEPVDTTGVLPLTNLKAVVAGDLPADMLGVKALDQWTLSFSLEVPRSKEEVFKALTTSRSFPVHPNYLVEINKGHPKAWLQNHHNSVEALEVELNGLPMARRQCGTCGKSPDACAACASKKQRVEVRLQAAQMADRNRYVSNGPFYIRSWSRGSNIETVKNPYYYDAETVRLDSVTYDCMENIEQIFNQYQRDEVDIALLRQANRHVMSRVNESCPEQLVSFQTPKLRIFCCNAEAQGVSDRRVRYALDLLLDREYLMEKTGLKGMKPMYHFDLSGQKDKVTGDGKIDKKMPWMRWNRKRRYAEATKQLKAAGYNEKNKLKLKIPHWSGSPDLLEVLSEEIWAHPYLEISFVQTDLTLLNADIVGRQYQMALCGLVFEAWDSAELFDSFSVENPGNRLHHFNPKYEELIREAARYGIDPEERSKLFEAAEAILINEHLVLAVNFIPTHWLVKPKVEGFKVANHPIGTCALKYLSIKPASDLSSNKK